MKYVIAGWIMFLMLTIMTSSGLSEEYPITIQHPDKFSPQKMEVFADGKVLVCGSTGEMMNSKGAMRIFDTEGNVIDITPSEDDLEGMYRDAFMIAPNDMIALRSVPNEYTWRIARLKNDEIVWMTGKTENVFDIERIDNRFLVYCKPEPVTAEIRCMDFDGNEVWKIRLEERIILEGLLIGEDMHIAYGSKMEDPIGDRDQRSTSLVFAFDSMGRIMWRHDGSELGFSAQYIDAAWADDGAVILTGTHCVSKYDKDGIIWNVEFSDAGMSGIVPMEESYLVSYNNYGETGIRFSKVNEEGVFSGDYYLEDAPSGQKDLILIGDTPYMVFHDPVSGEYMKLMKIEIH